MPAMSITRLDLDVNAIFSRPATGRLLAACALSACLLPGLSFAQSGTTPASDPPGVVEVVTDERPVIQLAILLDTSNSMDGLIDQARAQLWSTVNHMARAKRGGLAPRLEVAVFEYGNNQLPAAEGYVRQVVGFTHDLDAVSEALFSLDTDGGSEYCGQVLHEAAEVLAWSDDPRAYRTVFIAGNEPFTQGAMAYQEAVSAVVARGAVVNTIHCGDYNAGIEGHWQAGAHLGGGNYLNIDSDLDVFRHIHCPQDDRIAELNAQLNTTYRFYGTAAPMRAANQMAQDENAAGLAPAAMAERTEMKIDGLYADPEADLVDYYRANNNTLDGLAAEDMPVDLRGLTPAERLAHVQELSADRDALQQELAQLLAERETFAQAERERLLAESGEEDLQAVMTRTVQQQLVAAGFTFDDD